MVRGRVKGSGRERRAAVAAFDACFEPLAAVMRGDSIESIHRGVLAVVDAHGGLLGAVGDPGCRVLLRSSAKPFQAAALVASGAADAFSLSGAELALTAASHSGTAEHLELVGRLLERTGLSASALVCGPLEHNCSGKHTGMLLLARHLGASEEGYHLEDHPVQREIRTYIASLLEDGGRRGEPRKPGSMAPTGSAALFAGTDGCGVPVLGMTLLEAAWLFARLAAGATPELARVRDAMVAYPLLVAGEGRLDTNLIRAGSGRVVSKAGAEGVQGIGLRGLPSPAVAVVAPGSEAPSEAVGCVLKMEDGAGRAIPAVTAALLRVWGLEREAEAVEEAHPSGITDRTGAEVGRIEALVEAAAARRPQHSPSGAPACEDEAGWGAAGAPAPAARRLLGGRGDSAGLCRADDKNVVRFLREQWPSVDREYFGRPVEWTAEPWVLVYRRDRKVVAVLKGHFIGGLASVDELMVGAGARGCGLGSRLLGRFEDEARRRRCSQIVLRAVKGSPAEDFYRKRGYRRECVQYGYEFGYDYVRLVCDVERTLGESCIDPRGPAREPKGGS